MDVLRRYNSLRTYNYRGNEVSARYKRVGKTLSFNLLELDKPSTFDNLSLQFYGTPLMFWLIADFNDFLDPFITLQTGTKVKIPILE